MKNLLFVLVIVTILTSCSKNKDQFTIKGHVSGVDTGQVFLQKFAVDHWMNMDSVKLEKGKFTFTGKAGMPEMWHLAIPEKELSLSLFVENAAIEVEIYADSLDKSVVKGSPTQDIYKKYIATTETINQKMEEITKEWKAAKERNDTIAMKKIDSVSNDLDSQTKKALKDFITTNKTTVVAPYLAIRNSWQFELPELEQFLAGFDTSLVHSQYTQLLMKRVEVLKSVAIGQIAPDFTMNDSTGKPLTLSSLKGKILLVDFWASWCSPCRAENPNVVKAYTAYSKKGFDVLGCSFDQNREKWLKAVKSDKLAWHQVSDLKGWGNEAGKLYGINSIPANVLLDKDLKIIGRNLRGEELLAKLAEILGPASKK